MNKARIATTWLDGCSGCHMSLLDIDERLVELAEQIELVYSPLVDTLDFPEAVDIALVEGAVGNEDDLKKLQLIRKQSRLLVALGDCAVTANVPAMRNAFKLEEVLRHVYTATASSQLQLPKEEVPPLRDRVRPLHAYVEVDLFLPGCPPPSEAIFFLLSELLAGRIPDLSAKSRFGA
ncbi:NADH-quinone oxidoreductase subunit B family protein [Desulfogranum mediterraneum]|uniref:NADH-quinone oxidoreductase subunit B family protein n=1 Tax=Desulfogranum mediterraneum TaxID=160661 RepID=UPI00040E3A38|nr:NADP oxidoreductase [Desulfogranum mediterraneum]